MLSYVFIHTRVVRIATLTKSSGRSPWAGDRIGDQMSMYISLRVLWKCVIIAGLWVFFPPALNCQVQTQKRRKLIHILAFFYREKKITSLFPRAHFPSLLGSSECIVSQYKDLEGGMLSRAHLLYIPTFLYMKSCHLPANPSLGSASAPMTDMFRVDAACWATQGSCRGCPSSHVLHSRRMFLTLSNGMTLPGLGLSDWNATEKESPGVIQILTSPQPLLVFFIPF